MFHVKQPPAAAADVFGERLPAAVRYAVHLATSGVERGVIGPRETARLWDRHLLNCAVVAEVVPAGARVVDLGSGAGLPGIPLALARPDLHVVLIEPLARRVDWLDEVIADLDLSIQVVRGRAEETSVRRRWEGADVVTARAVAPLARLAGWALPLLRTGGTLAAIKGASVADEVDRDTVGVRKSGGSEPRIVQCGAGLIEPTTTVVLVERLPSRHGGPRARTSRRKERRS
ncbi:16S rRNA (guanine(527)-N(7))-methyltransferase RsmG [Pseudonocardia hispaniensis]|uniref:Ribosomal RNA small subunit methyltransferase G n=1 Tax=Pseudonocardia hispaniensis TaxID=904933 RepID=A0ABW1J695_9PSEU